MTDGHPEHPRLLRWTAGVPIGTNPIILLDIAKLSLLLWCSVVLLVGLLQFFFAGTFSGGQIRTAMGLANRLVALTGAVFLIVAFLCLHNRYIVLCRLDDEGAYCESFRGGWGPLSESLHWRSFSINRPLDTRKSVRRAVPWTCLNEVRPQRRTRTILLRKGSSTVLRLYCPDERLFEQAVAFLNARKSVMDVRRP